MSARVAPFALVLLLHGVAGTVARADVVTEWNIKAGELMTAARLGAGPAPTFVTTSPTASGAARRWPSTDAFIQEVAEARIYDGVHYRFSAEAGLAMGRQIGALAAQRFLQE